MNWSEILLETLLANDVRLASYVPDQALASLIRGFGSHPEVSCFTATREDEAVAIAAGAALGGLRSVTMMQSSGFGNIANALSSLVTPYQIPLLLIVSERGVLGEFNPVQVPITRVLRPTLDALSIPHMTLSRPDEVAEIVDRLASQCYRTQQTSAVILSPLLTGGKREPGSAPRLAA